jgi:hypothetical protein
MKKLKKQRKTKKKGLDKVSGKKGRGRPESIPRSWVTGRAYNYRFALAQVWPKLSGPLVAATTGQEIASAFENHAQPYVGEFVPRLVPDILVLIRDPKFPKTEEARIAFLADSLGGRPSISFRTSRDICGDERRKVASKSPHKIIRKEFYIECECGYKGPARDSACRKCGAEIPISLETIWGNTGLFR